MRYGKTIEAAKLARERGEKWYFTGLPCKAGHVAERQVSNSTCRECLRDWRRANPKSNRCSLQKRRQIPEVRARELASERKCRKAPHRQAALAATVAARRAAQKQRTPKWADLKEIRKFYDLSHWMTKVTGIEHHVDHEIPLNGKLVSGLHIAENLRVLPGPENLAKGSKFMTN
jgi:hypothetical protein